jgi:hypothetical protein
LRVLDGGRGDSDSLHDVIGTATDRPDAETVSSGAGSSSEGDRCSRVDGEAVILVDTLIE